MSIPELIGMVTLGIALAGCSPEVPSVVGLKAEQAKEQLEKAGFKPNTTYQEKIGAPVGDVLSQNPKASERASKGSVVTIEIAKGATITGSFELVDKDISRGGPGECQGTGGFSDINQNMQVVVLDGKRNTIATGNLEADNYSGEYSNVACAFPFRIENVPISDFYEIEVGRRGSLKYSLDEMRSKKWNLMFSLGSD
jgi:hypothetical protein